MFGSNREQFIWNRQEDTLSERDSFAGETSAETRNISRYLYIHHKGMIACQRDVEFCSFDNEESLPVL